MKVVSSLLIVWDDTQTNNGVCFTAESVFDGTASEDGLLSADESKCSSITPASGKLLGFTG